MALGEECDLLIIGGGINGAGIARDAAGRGLKVVLCEQGDLANYTSSASTKLVHGGLRYLEYFEFMLVRKALREREVLLGIAPHIIWPMRFIMPHVRQLRPAWMIRLGLFLYDHLGGRKRLPGSNAVALRDHVAGAPLDEALVKGFEYSDCWVQDARLVVLNCQDAALHGASILPRTRCVDAERDHDGWTATLRSSEDGRERRVRARMVVNAAGPWVSRVLGDATHRRPEKDVQLVKGSHIVVPRLFDHGYAYIFQHTDGRIVFAIPYEGDFTLIGTTDVSYDGDPAEATASDEEIDYLCQAVNRYFRRSIGPDDVVWTYSGVRALYDEQESDNASAVSRDYELSLDRDGAALLSVFGGKITTYRTLANEALERIATVLPVSAGPWTGERPLPGGDMPGADFDACLRMMGDRYPWVPESLLYRWVRNYGTRVDRLIGDAVDLAGLGEHFGADLYEAELRYLYENEWAVTAEDVLWRRSKLGLRLSEAQAQAVQDWLSVRQAEERGTSHVAGVGDTRQDGRG
jgi:glycerol-3-phosphate dehydrogenase